MGKKQDERRKECFAGGPKSGPLCSLGQPLSVSRCCVCIFCIPEITPALPYNGALESKLCIVPGLPGNAIYLVLGPTVWLFRGQLDPQPLLGLLVHV